MTKSNFNRRKFIKYITFAAGTLCISSNGFSAFLFKNRQTAEQVKTEITKVIKGEVLSSKVLLQEFSTDFGKVIQNEPAIVVIPKDEADIIAVLKIANDREIPVSIRGTGHSCFGQTLSNGGIVLAKRSSNPEIHFKNNEVKVSGDCSWMDLEKHLNKLGLTSPVLTDYLGLSVGGTLSVGGYGLRSFKYGGQVDNITELELLLPSGEKRTCSMSTNKDLFRYSLSGLGQLGQIQSAKFNPIPYKKHTVIYYLHSQTIDIFIDACKTIFSTSIGLEIDHFSAYMIGGSIMIEIGKSFLENEKKEYTKLQNLILSHFKHHKKNMVSNYHFYIHQVREKWVKRYGASYHLWEDYVFDLDSLQDFLHQTAAKKEYQNHSILPALYFLAFNSSSSSNIPFAPIPKNSSSMQYGVGFYYMVKIGDTKGKVLAQNQLQQNRDICIKIGGRPYLYGWHYLGEKEKNILYGKDYENFKLLKKKYDPSNIINPGIFA